MTINAAPKVVTLEPLESGVLSSRYPTAEPPASGGTPALNWQAPSGVLTGSPLIISTDGTYNFGTKPTASPLVFDDFSLGTLGAQVRGQPAIVGTWDTGGGDAGVTYSNDVVRASPKSAKHNFITDFNSSLCKNLVLDQFYLDYWTREERLDIISRNWKLWRAYGPADDLQMNPVQLCNSIYTVLAEASTSLTQIDYNWPGYVPESEWVHIQCVFRQSDPGVANGTFIHQMNCQRAGFDTTTLETRRVAQSFDQMRIGHYRALDGVVDCQPNAGASVYTDSVYLDTSWARIEIGDNADYNQCTHREIQLPTNWTTNTIYITLRLGTLPPGTHYLFVVDGTNTVLPSVAVPIP